MTYISDAAPARKGAQAPSYAGPDNDSTTTALRRLNQGEAKRFLDALHGADSISEPFAFQTFDDKSRENLALIRTWTGPFAQSAAELERLNKAGAGVFVTISKTDGRGRKAENAIRIRALFADLDGAPIGPVQGWCLKPYVIIESSPGRFHAYWRHDGSVKLENFTQLQLKLATLFDADPMVHDVPRVMRLPGAWHQKGEPFQTRIVAIDETAPAYSLADFERALTDVDAPEPSKGKPKPERNPREQCRAAEWINQEALFRIADWAPIFFPGGRFASQRAWRVPSSELGRHCEEDLAIHPDGIKDFGQDWADHPAATYTAIGLLMAFFNRTESGDLDLVTEFDEFGTPNGTLSYNDAAAALADALGYDWQELLKEDVERWADSFEAIGETSEELKRSRGGCELEDFVAYMPAGSFMFMPTRELWPASSVNARVPPVDVGADKPIPASRWLATRRAVEQMTWAPGKPMKIKDQLISEGGWIERPGCTVFNLYRPPTIVPKCGPVDPWLDHIRHLFGDESAEHIIRWLAHRVQRPHEKVNHSLVLGGAQGVGKDTALEPVKTTIGPWNFIEVSPRQMLGRFNGFVRAVILRVNEARDLGHIDRFAFYDHMKAYTAAPPDVLRVDEKFTREYYVLNVCGIIITSNHKTDGIYLPPDDRRHFVAWSELTKDDFPAEYWRRLYAWYADGGIEHVGAYLHALDISGFDAKAPPPKTAAFHEIVGASRAPEDAELADVLDALGRPPATTLEKITQKASEIDHYEFAQWLRDRKHARQVPHRLEECGYVRVENPRAQDGRFKIQGRRQVIYARQNLSLRDRIAAAEQLAR